MGLLRLLERCRRNAVVDSRHHGAVARGVIVEIVCRPDTARARHVLHDDRGTSRQMGGQEAREQTAVGIIDAGGTAADDEADLLASVEVLLACVRGITEPNYRDENRKASAGKSNNHRPTTDNSAAHPASLVPISA